MPGCRTQGAGNVDEPLSLSGEVFLLGPDEARTAVSCDRRMAVELTKLLDAGVAAADRKDQGVAALRLVYPGNGEETIELTKTGLARRAKKVVQLDEGQMQALLQHMLKECAEK
jgi:hypothetical protein